MVAQILQNEVYLGHMVQGRRRSTFGKAYRVASRDEWIIVHDTHDALIDEQTFLVVQQMAEQGRNTYREREGRYESLGTIPHIFLGLIFCSCCKRPMIRRKNIFNGKRLVYTYSCSSHVSDPASCPTRSIHEQELKKVLWDVVQHEITAAVDLEKLVHKYSSSPKSIRESQTIEREMASTARAQQRASMLYDSLYQNYVDNLMTEQEYIEMKCKYRADVERSKARLNELERQKRDMLSQTTQNIWLTTYRRFQDETELTEEMTHALIQRVEINAEKRISVTLRYQDEYRALAELLNPEGQVHPV